MSGRLERSRTNRVISGVCGGIAEYLDIDATFVRVVMVILAFPFGIGVLIYFARSHPVSVDPCCSEVYQSRYEISERSIGKISALDA